MVFNNNLLLGSSGPAGSGFTVDNSILFNEPDDEYLTRTPDSASNQKTWTFSTWIKRGKLGSDQRIFTATNNGCELFFDANDKLNSYQYTGGSYVWNYITTQVFKDPHAWYHIVVRIDTTQATASNRVRLYVNGEQITAFDTSTAPSLNATGYVNSAVAHYIGRYSGSNSMHYDGYLAQTILVDGAQLPPTNFGETDDNGVWRPIELTDTLTASTTAEAISNVTSAKTGTGATNYEFSSVSLGTAAATRAAYVFASAQDPEGDNVAVSSITINVGGSDIAGSLVSVVDSGAEPHYSSELWRVDVPTGTSGTVDVNWDQPTSQCGIIVWTVTGDHFLYDLKTDVTNSTSSVSFTGVPDNSVILAGKAGTGGRRSTWSSAVDENVDEDIDSSGVYHTGASKAHSTGGSFTVTCTPDDTDSRPRMIAIVLSPYQGMGTNGFYLPYSNSAALGQDDSGSSSTTVVQKNTYNAGSEINEGDTAANPSTGMLFIPTATGTVSKIELNASARGFSGVTVRLETDSGSGTAPSGTIVPNGEVTGITSSGAGLKTATFSTPPEVTAGVKYWIVLRGDTGTWGWQHDVSGVGPALGLYQGSTQGYFSGRGVGHYVYMNGNHFEAVNTPIQTNDSPTNNYCVWSEVFPKRSGNWTLSEGNRKASYSSATDCGCPGSIGVSGAGTWYFEITASSSYTLAGIVSAKAVSSGDLASSTPGNGFSDLGGVAYGYYANNGYKLGGPSNVYASYGATFANTDVIGVAFDAANGTLTFYKNGSTQGEAFTGISTSETWFPFVHTWTNEPGVLLNNGQTAFAHTPPTGYVGINTTNLLSASTPTIEDGSAYFQTTLYTGNGASSHEINQSGENSTFAPDFLWTKGRTTTEHRITDILRGATKVFFTDSSLGNSASTTETTSVLSLDSDGFTVGSGGGTNSSGDAKLGWQWKAGDSNTAVSASGSGDGYINACTHRANQTAGFSLVKYTGANSQISNGQNTKVTHGLGAKPELAFIKNMDDTQNWRVLSTSTTGFAADSQTGDDAHLVLNSNAIVSGSLFTGHFESGSDSTHFEVGNDNGVNKNGDEFMAFLFRSIPGYCKVTSYEGNGNSDGIFLELGFKASWIMFKRYTGSTASWAIYDKARDPFNAAENMLIVESTAGDNVGNKIDILSNGVKIRGTSGAYNGSGNEYLVLAFAEHPFIGTTPATAR